MSWSPTCCYVPAIDKPPQLAAIPCTVPCWLMNRRTARSDNHQATPCPLTRSAATQYQLLDNSMQSSAAIIPHPCRAPARCASSLEWQRCKADQRVQARKMKTIIASRCREHFAGERTMPANSFANRQKATSFRHRLQPTAGTLDEMTTQGCAAQWRNRQLQQVVQGGDIASTQQSP